MILVESCRICRNNHHTFDDAGSFGRCLNEHLANETIDRLENIHNFMLNFCYLELYNKSLEMYMLY